jgi:hypothetical protein
MRATASQNSTSTDPPDPRDVFSNCGGGTWTGGGGLENSRTCSGGTWTGRVRESSSA